MSERYWRCKQCGVLAADGISMPCTGPFEPVEVWPEGTVARLKDERDAAAARAWHQCFDEFSAATMDDLDDPKWWETLESRYPKEEPK